jgi:ubiquitin fusion degradation protein 1
MTIFRRIAELDIESPWTFELVNPIKRQLKTHAGVLEFTAEEGNVYLPSWMMKRLELNEGDGIRLFGTRLPKGKLVKLQAQSVTFLELSDPKAVLEQALRAYSALTKGDIIEISYNMMTFELLVMEVQPDTAGIYIREVDLEVDFAPPVGYVEPERKPAAPAPTMQSKFSISIGATQSVDAKGSGSSTPVGGAGPAGHGGKNWEAFKGTGQSMAGKRIRGKGISLKKAEAVEEGSKIWRSDKPKIVTPDTQIGDRKVPAKLDLPEGVLFFGFRSTPPAAEQKPDAEQLKQNAGETKPPGFDGAGQGATLSGRSLGSGSSSSAARIKKKVTKSKGTSQVDAIAIDSD